MCTVCGRECQFASCNFGFCRGSRRSPFWQTPGFEMKIVILCSKTRVLVHNYRTFTGVNVPVKTKRKICMYPRRECQFASCNLGVYRGFRRSPFWPTPGFEMKIVVLRRKNKGLVHHNRLCTGVNRLGPKNGNICTFPRRKCQLASSRLRARGGSRHTPSRQTTFFFTAIFAAIPKGL